jgi:sulfur-oxidizing protein SoxY
VNPTRRGALAAGALAVLVRPVLLRPAAAQEAAQMQTPEAHAEAVRAFTGGAEPIPGLVAIDLPPLVENGNAAPITVTVESPMTAENHVRRIAILNEKNPQPHVIEAQLSPRSGRAVLSTRMRLATSQRITALAETSDGRFHIATADVIVTLAACVEG